MVNIEMGFYSQHFAVSMRAESRSAEHECSHLRDTGCSHFTPRPGYVLIILKIGVILKYLVYNSSNKILKIHIFNVS